MIAISPWKKSREPMTIMSRAAKLTHPAQKPLEATVLLLVDCVEIVPILSEVVVSAVPPMWVMQNGTRTRHRPRNGCCELPAARCVLDDVRLLPDRGVSVAALQGFLGHLSPSRHLRGKEGPLAHLHDRVAVARRVRLHPVAERRHVAPRPPTRPCWRSADRC